jgi:hypothetical protein
MHFFIIFSLFFLSFIPNLPLWRASLSAGFGILSYLQRKGKEAETSSA